MTSVFFHLIDIHEPDILRADKGQAELLLCLFISRCIFALRQIGFYLIRVDAVFLVFDNTSCKLGVVLDGSISEKVVADGDRYHCDESYCTGYQKDQLRPKRDLPYRGLIDRTQLQKAQWFLAPAVDMEI